MNRKWKLRFLGLSEYIAQWSKDPSTKVGAVIVRPDKSIVSMGFNGFPLQKPWKPVRPSDGFCGM